MVFYRLLVGMLPALFRQHHEKGPGACTLGWLPLVCAASFFVLKR
jgi:hypothetical protein